MSKVTASIRLMHKMLQCSLCHQQYDLYGRAPKGMRCMHTFCKACLDSLGRGYGVRCPTCKRETLIADLVTNCALTDVLETLCEECTNEERVVICLHCDKHVCTSCYDSHAETYHSEVKIELQGLVGEIDLANGLLMDQRRVEQERVKEEDAMNDIRTTVQYHRNELDSLEKELRDKVKLVANANSKKLLDWREKLEVQIGKTNQFVMQAENKLGTVYSRNCMFREMVEICAESSKMSTALQHAKNDIPEVIEYNFSPEEDRVPPVVGHVEMADSALQTIFTVASYKHVTVRRRIAGFGSGIHELNHPRSVACLDDRIFVLDEYNHRVKVYDLNLRLLFLFGSKGSKSQHFQHPWGVAIGPEEEIYITDCLNHRVKVYNKFGEKLRIFGSKGSAANEFRRPLGIAVHAGEIYVCDADNYRVKVLQRDGTCVRCIGSKGEGAGQFLAIPKALAITSDERVLVSESNVPNLHVFATKTGDYIDQFPKQTTELSEINSVAVDPQNNVVLASHSGDLVVFNAKGGLACMLNPQEQLAAPSGVLVTKEGLIIVSDIGNHSVQIFKFGS